MEKANRLTRCRAAHTVTGTKLAAAVYLIDTLDSMPCMRIGFYIIYFPSKKLGRMARYTAIEWMCWLVNFQNSGLPYRMLTTRPVLGI